MNKLVNQLHPVEKSIHKFINTHYSIRGYDSHISEKSVGMKKV